MAEPYYGGIDSRSILGRGLSTLDQGLNVAGDIAQTGVNQLGSFYDEYNPMELLRKGAGAIGDAAYGLVAPPTEPAQPKSPFPQGYPERPLPTGNHPTLTPENIQNFNNPLGLPPMRVPGSPGSADAPVQAAAPKPSPVRAVRMPDGKIVFTNLGGEGLGEEGTRQAARSIGQAGPQGPAPDPINLASHQSYELVQRAAEAPQNGGGFSAMELSPGDDGLATPGYYRQQEQQAEDRLGGYERRSALADAASRAKLAEAWAKMTPEDRLRAEAALKAAEKPNFPLQTIEYLQQQDAILAQQAQEIQRGLATIVNVDNPDTKRLKAEGAAKLAAIEAERKRLLEIGGLPFRADTSMIGAGGYNPYNPAGAGAITP